MLGSLYSFPRGLVLVSTHGFYPKITSIMLPKSETGVVRELPHSKGQVLWGAVVPAAIQAGKAPRMQLGKRPKVSF